MQMITPVNPPGASEMSERHEMPRRHGAYLVAGSLLLVMVGTVGARNPWALVWVERLFHHTYIFGLFALIAFFVGLAVLLPRPSLRPVMWVAGFVVSFLWTVVGLYIATFHEPAIDTIPAPDGAGFELVVRSSSDGVINPAWVFEIRQTGSPLARYWQFGCMSGDAPRNGYRSARWEGTERLVLTAVHGNEVRVEVNPDTGEPVEPSDNPWTCSGWS